MPAPWTPATVIGVFYGDQVYYHGPIKDAPKFVDMPDGVYILNGGKEWWHKVHGKSVTLEESDVPKTLLVYKLLLSL